MHAKILIPILALVLSAEGCLSIHQGLDVQRPTEINQAQNPTKKCPERPYLYKFIRGECSSASRIVMDGGPRIINSQQEFDLFWPGITATLDPSITLTANGVPQIDGTNNQVLLFPIKNENSCHQIVFSSMKTDCLSVKVWMSQWNETKDCESHVTYPVFILIYPRTTLPVSVDWTFDADDDGISNESALKLGRDPMAGKK